MIDISLLTNFGSACSKSFLGFPTWYKYLEVRRNDFASCDIIDFRVPGDFLLIGLAVIDILFRVIGLVAVYFVLYGGVQYVISQSEPDKVSKAQNTIQTALLGLVLSFAAVAIISFLGRRLT